MMYLLIAALAAQAVTINPRSVAFLKGSTPPFLDITWKEQPSEAEIQRAAPPNIDAWRYGSIECKGVSEDGHVTGCSAAKVDAPDMEGNKAALQLAKYFVLAEDLVRQRSNIDFLTIDIQFRYEGVDFPGRCAPAFCTITPPPPPPPPPPPAKAHKLRT